MAKGQVVKDGVQLTSPDDIAQYFNDHFCSVASNLCDSLPNSNFDPLTYVRRNDCSFVLGPVTSDEVGDTIMSLKNSKQGINSITVKILKYSKHMLSHPLSHLVNLSFIQGVFPHVLKNACVIPI